MNPLDFVVPLCIACAVIGFAAGVVFGVITIDSGGE